MINVENLTKIFGKVKAVDGISFNVQKGEIFGLLGENGAGKTTTLRMLATMLKPSAGVCKHLRT
jgi:sodium transport system ATP-binding protein